MTAAIVMPDGDPLCERLFADPRRRAALDALGGVRVHTDGPLQEPGLYVERCRSARAVILGMPLPDEVLALPGVEVVTFMGTGAANHVNLDEARRQRVAVCNTPGYGDTAVAEHTVALILASLRGIPQYDAAMRRGEWPASHSAREVAGSTVGIVGFGGIGSKVATVLHAMGARVLVSARNPDRHRAAHPYAEFTDLGELMASSDIVSLHLALTPDTRTVIDRALLDRLRPGALLVNTARAELVDEAHLASLVAAGTITAAVDVFAPEPLPADSPLRTLPGIVLTPHVAFNTPGAMERMADITVRNLEAHFAGTAQNRVD